MLYGHQARLADYEGLQGRLKEQQDLATSLQSQVCGTDPPSGQLFGEAWGPPRGILLCAPSPSSSLPFVFVPRLAQLKQLRGGEYPDATSVKGVVESVSQLQRKVRVPPNLFLLSHCCVWCPWLCLCTTCLHCPLCARLW